MAPAPMLVAAPKETAAMMPYHYPATDYSDPRLTGPVKDTDRLVWYKVIAAIVVTVVMAGLSALLLLVLD